MIRALALRECSIHACEWVTLKEEKTPYQLSSRNYHAGRCYSLMSDTAVCDSFLTWTFLNSIFTNERKVAVLDC